MGITESTLGLWAGSTGVEPVCASKAACFSCATAGMDGRVPLGETLPRDCIKWRWGEARGAHGVGQPLQHSWRGGGLGDSGTRGCLRKG